MNKPKDLQGKTFGRLTAVTFQGYDKNHRAQWLVKCSCGAEKTVRGSSLSYGAVKSCGCLSREIRSVPGYNNTLPRGESAFNSLYHRYKSSATRRNLEFLISKCDFRRLTQSHCHYCNEPPQHSTTHGRNGEYMYNGIDRVDNTRGYTPENCVTCCGDCNQMKMDFIEEAWYRKMSKILKHRGKI